MADRCGAAQSRTPTQQGAPFVWSNGTTPSPAPSPLGSTLDPLWDAGREPSEPLLDLMLSDSLLDDLEEQLLPETLAHTDALPGPALVARAPATAAGQPPHTQRATLNSQAPPAVAVGGISSLMCSMLGLPMPRESAPGFRRPPPAVPLPAQLPAAVTAPPGALPLAPAALHCSSSGEDLQSSNPASGGLLGSSSSGVEGLTEQQVRRRQQQRDYLKRKKGREQAMEEQMELLAMELAELRMANESAKLEVDLQEKMLQYKEDMLAALLAGSNDEAAAGTTLTPEQLLYLELWDAGGALGPDVVLRLAVNHHTDNLDDRGLPKTAPPFEWLVEDYSNIVKQLREVLEAAAEAGKQVELEGGQELALQTSKPIPLRGQSGPDLPPWRLLVLEGQQGREEGGEREGGEGERTLTPPGAGLTEQAEQARQPEQQQQQQQAEQPLAKPQGPSAIQAATQQEAGAAGGEAELCLPARFLEECKQHNTGKHAMHGGGLVVQAGDTLYKFAPSHLKAVAGSVQRAASLVLQQAILFPENSLRWRASRMDTGELCDGRGQEGHWERVVEALHLHPEQLQLMAEVHKGYVATVTEVAQRRLEATQRLQELQEELARAVDSGLAAEMSRLSLAMQSQAAALERCVHEDHTAEIKCTTEVGRLMDFPLQHILLLVSSWPYFPKTSAIAGLAASLAQQGQQGQQGQHQQAQQA